LHCKNVFAPHNQELVVRFFVLLLRHIWSDAENAAVQTQESTTVLILFTLTWRIFASFLLKLAGECPFRPEAGKAMSVDRLIRTARAAGFAMACDDVAGNQASVQQTAATPVPVRHKPTALLPAPTAAQMSSWTPSSWGFWKTA
jgi:hypothetical protein